MKKSSPSCPTKKRVYDSAIQAEQALVDHQSAHHFAPGKGPIAIYKCDLCGGYHFTSKGPVNPALDATLRAGDIERAREARHWEHKFRGKR